MAIKGYIAGFQQAKLVQYVAVTANGLHTKFITKTQNPTSVENITS